MRIKIFNNKFINKRSLNKIANKQIVSIKINYLKDYLNTNK
jgi:hypothetical protein